MSTEGRVCWRAAAEDRGLHCASVCAAGDPFMTSSAPLLSINSSSQFGIESAMLSFTTQQLTGGVRYGPGAKIGE
jgi:hypothetical protein